MDTRRKAKRGIHQITPQHGSQQEPQLVEELNDNRLTKLLAFVSSLERTPLGVAELQRRRRLFGDCTQCEGETSDQFYARLRHWLDRGMPDSEVQLYRSRQTDD